MSYPSVAALLLSEGRPLPPAAPYVGAALTAGGVLAVAYRLGRTHAAWHEVTAAKHAVRTNRRVAWAHTIRLAAGIAIVLIALLAAGFNLAR
ncbi:hypothetical protein AB0C07_33455 [Actinoplanes missouriensis]|uniref:hypothetical protein n=1 Tax=Actinoplanes missouriensis TaxID=1866 RepID=UPI0033CFAE3C